MFMYALITSTAMGAAASAPNPPPCTMTPTAIGDACPLLPGTKQVKTASLEAAVVDCRSLLFRSCRRC